MPKMPNLIVTLHAGVAEAARAHGVPGSGSAGSEPARWTYEEDAGPLPWKGEFPGPPDALATAARRLGAAGGSVIIAYQAPTVTADVLNVPVSGGEVIEAARLGLLSSLAGAGDSLAEDPPMFTVAVAGSDGASTRVLAGADPGSAPDALAAWARAAGMNLAGIVPARAAVLHAGIRHFAAQAGKGPRALLLLGAGSSAFAAGRDGAPALVRSLDIGIDTLAAAIARVLGTDSRGALDALRTQGLPRRDASDRSVGMPEAVRPHLQPMVQRIGVEIRQSIRFGLTDGQAAPERLVLAGPGADAPGLADALSTLLDLRVESAPADSSLSDPGAALRAWTLDAARAGVRLIPRAEARRRSTRRLNRAIVVGGLAACAAIAAEASLTFRQIRAAEQAVLALAPEVARHQEAAQRLASAAQRRDRVVALEAAARSLVGKRPDWLAVLGELSRTPATGVRVSEVSASFGAQGPTMTFKGVASGAVGPDPLASFFDALRGSPLIARVEMGSTRLLEGAQPQSKVFSLEAVLHSLPFTLSDAATEARP